MITKLNNIILLSSLTVSTATLQAASILTPVDVGSQAGWTVQTDNNVELGMRGKIRYPSGTNNVGSPYTDNGVYTFNRATDFGSNFAATPNNRSMWNFDFSINVNADGLGSNDLTDYTYQIQIDTDPSATTNFITFDLVTPGGDPDPTKTGFDHSLSGDGGVSFDNFSNTGTDYATNLGNYQIAQNSWNLGFFTNLTAPAVDGEYTITLNATNTATNAVTSNSIQIDQINQIPEPATGIMAIIGAGLLAFRRRRM